MALLPSYHDLFDFIFNTVTGYRFYRNGVNLRFVAGSYTECDAGWRRGNWNNGRYDCSALGSHFGWILGCYIVCRRVPVHHGWFLMGSSVGL